MEDCEAEVETLERDKILLPKSGCKNTCVSVTNDENQMCKTLRIH